MRYANDRLYTEQLRRVRDRLAVISSRRRNHTRLLLLIAQARHQIDSAADFECTNGLMILVLDKDIEPEMLGEPRIVMHRGRLQISVDDAFRVEDIGENRRLHLTSFAELRYP